MKIERSRVQMGMRAVAATACAALLVATLGQPSQAKSTRPQGKVDPVLLAAAKANPNAEFDVIVQATPQSSKLAPHAKADTADRAGKAVKRSGDQPRRPLGFVGSASAKVKGSHILGLSKDPDVAYIFRDVHLNAKFDPVGGAPLVTGPGDLSVNAPAAWSQFGVTGRGIGVAVVDSGVYGHADLAGRVVAAIDFTAAAPAVSPVPLGDPGGHGTHVAGLIAGDGTASGGAYTGVAPNANIIDVRVIDSSGGSNMSTVLAGLQWVLANRATYNIRVVNLSLGAPEQVSYRLSILNTAVEVLTLAGITVVVSAGNNGPACGTITTPADDPFAITVGAADDAGTATLADDSLSWFSSCGPTTYDGLAKPDLVAPGRHMVSLFAPGSALDALYPEREVVARGETTASYFQLSGTSMAAPVVTGAVALMLEHDPTLTPALIKQRLVASATPVSYGTTATRGSGLLNVLAAVGSTEPLASGSDTPITDAFAQTALPLLEGQTLVWRDLGFNGGVDSRGIPWPDVTWSNISWDSITWDSITWDAFAWQDITWDSIAAQDITWDSLAAQDITWDSAQDPLRGTGPGWSPLN